MTARSLYNFRGVDRYGVARAGTLESARGPAVFVEERHRGGWRSLTVTRGGVEVGAIVPASRERRGGRTWWAECIVEAN